jgi:hypothetical protein
MSRDEIKALSELTGQSQAQIRREWLQWRRLELAAENPGDWVILKEPSGEIRAIKKDLADAIVRGNRDYERYYAR